MPILLYHSISRQAAPRYRLWAVAPETFAAHLAYLQENRYTPITVAAVAQAMAGGQGRLPKRPVALTFDDGLADFHTDALPLLQRHNFTATLYVAAGFVGGTSRWLAPEGEGERPMLNWSQLVEVADQGIACGSHGRSHCPLDLLPPAAAMEEIAGSKRSLEAGLGRPVTTFAYPYGYYSGAVRRLVQQAGYSSACAVKHTISTTADDRFTLARIQVLAGMEVDRLAAALAGQGLPVAPHARAEGRRTLERWAARARRALGRAAQHRALGAGGA